MEGITLEFGDPRLALRLSWETARDEKGGRQVNAVLSLPDPKRSTDGEAVRLLDPWGQAVCILKPGFARLPTRYAAAYPTEDRGAALHFSVGPCSAAFYLPKSMERHLRAKMAGNVFTVSHRGGGQAWGPLVRCKLNPQGGPLVWEINERAAKQCPSWVDHLVIEVFDPTAGVVRQCMRRRRPARFRLVPRSTGTGSSAASDAREECSFLYPWPRTLVLSHPEINKGKPLGFSDLFTKEYRGNIDFVRKVDSSSSTSRCRG